MIRSQKSLTHPKELPTRVVILLDTLGVTILASLRGAEPKGHQGRTHRRDRDGWVRDDDPRWISHGYVASLTFLRDRSWHLLCLEAYLEIYVLRKIEDSKRRAAEIERADKKLREKGWRPSFDWDICWKPSKFAESSGNSKDLSFQQRNQNWEDSGARGEGSRERERRLKISSLTFAHNYWL